MQNFTLARVAETPCSTWGRLSRQDGTSICSTLERGAHNLDHVRITAATYAIGRKAIGQSEFDHTFADYLGADYHGILWLPNVPGRTNIELHTANEISQLLGCIASGNGIDRDAIGDFIVIGGTSLPAYKKLYLAISPFVDADGAQLIIRDIP